MPRKRKKSNEFEPNPVSALVGLVIVTILIAVVIWFMSRDVDDTVKDHAQDTEITEEEAFRVSVVFDNLPVIVDGFYELWIETIHTKNVITTFHVDVAGVITALDNADVSGSDIEVSFDLSNAETAGVTVVDNEGNGIEILRGNVSHGVAALESSFVENYVDARGGFTLMSPSDKNENNELSGIWFVEQRENQNFPSLGIPEAPVGWEYYAWIEQNAELFPIGVFTDPVTEDSGNPFSGSEDVPLFPGEDFIYVEHNSNDGTDETTEIQLNTLDTQVIVALQPNGLSTDYRVNVFKKAIPVDATANTVYELENIVERFLPSGLIVIR